MALPLLGILAAELGVLGGVQFLRNKADDKSAEGAAQQFQSFMSPGGAGAPIAANNPLAAAGLIDRMLQIRESEDGFLNTGKTAGINSLFAEAQALLENQQAQELVDYERGQKTLDRNTTLTDQLDQDYRADLGTFGQVVQPAFRKILAALDNPNSADSLASVYNFFNIVEPGGIVRDPETQAYRGIGGKGSQIANWLNEWRGQGLTAPTRKQIIDAVWNQYAPEWERAQAQKRKYESDLQNYQAQGYNPRTPVGRQGINWDINQIPPDYFDPDSSKLPIPAGMRVVDE